MSKFATTTIDPDGAPLTVQIVFDGDSGPRTVIGTYDYYLWASSSSAYIDHKPGNNVDQTPDLHPLPLPNALNVGRMIEIRSHFAAPVPPESPQKYTITAILRQGATILTTAQDNGTVDAKGNVQFTQLLIKMN